MNPKYQKVCAEIAKTEKKIEDLQEQIRSCINALERIKTANLPEEKPVTAFDYDRVESRSRSP